MYNEKALREAYAKGGSSAMFQNFMSTNKNAKRSSNGRGWQSVQKGTGPNNIKEYKALQATLDNERRSRAAQKAEPKPAPKPAMSRESLADISSRYGQYSTFGHKDYEMARKSGYSNNDIKSWLDEDSSRLHADNQRGGSAGLYDEISSKTVDLSKKVDIDRGRAKSTISKENAKDPVQEYKPQPTPSPTPSPTPRLIPRPFPRPTPILDDSSSSSAKDLAVGSNKNFENNVVGNNNSDIGNDRSYNYGPDTPNKLQAAKDLAEERLTSNVTTDSKQTVGSNKDFKNEITGNNNKNVGNDFSYNFTNQGGGSGSGSGLNNIQNATAFNEKSSPDTPNKLQAAKDLAEARLTSNVTTDSKQTVGSNKDFKNEITGNNNQNVGNDFSVNIGNQGGGSDDGFNNMQSAMAFIGLNDNRAAKDEALFNPYDDVGLSMKAIDDAAGKNVDQRLYNSIGYEMNYYDNKAKEIDNMTFGDIWQFQAPDYKMPSSPSDPFKKVKS